MMHGLLGRSRWLRPVLDRLEGSITVCAIATERCGKSGILPCSRGNSHEPWCNRWASAADG